MNTVMIGFEIYFGAEPTKNWQIDSLTTGYKEKKQ